MSIALPNAQTETVCETLITAKEFAEDAEQQPGVTALQMAMLYARLAQVEALERIVGKAADIASDLDRIGECLVFVGDDLKRIADKLDALPLGTNGGIKIDAECSGVVYNRG